MDHSSENYQEGWTAAHSGNTDVLSLAEFLSETRHLVDDADLVDEVELLSRESRIVCDAAGRIVSWNAASERLYGWRKSNSVGRLLLPLIRQEIISSDNTVPPALRTMHEDDNLFDDMPLSYWELDFSAAQSMIKSLVSNGVTDLGGYLSANPKFVRQLMRMTQVLNVNNRSVDLFGRGRRNELLRDVEAFWPESATEVFAECIAATFSGISSFTRETRQRTLDGKEFDVLFAVRHNPQSVADGRMVVNILENTDLKCSQATLRETQALYGNMFHSSSVSAWRLDATALHASFGKLKRQGIIDLPGYVAANPDFVKDALKGLIVKDVNDATLQLFGANDRGELIGTSVERFWMPGHYQAFLESIGGSFNEEPVYRGETVMRTLDGRDIQVLFTRAASSELRALNQVLVGIVDVTDRVNAENALVEMQAALAHADRVSLVGELNATIAHEINQPLGAIATNAHAGLRWLDYPEPKVDEVRKLTKWIIADVQRAAAIVDRIHSMVTPHEPIQKRLSLNKLICDTMAFLKPQLSNGSVALNLELSEGIPDVMGDAVRLQQVFVNLALNAIQAMENIVDPHLLIRTSSAISGEVCVEVEDTGPGIAKEHSTRIFERFFTTKTTGMGIGLAMCRSIVEAQGGTIVVANAPLSGARVTLRFPAAPAE